MPIQSISTPAHYKTTSATLKSSQRVLYIQQLNDEFSITPEAVSGLTTVEDVLAYFKPEVDAILFDCEEAPIYETFRFRQMDDFTPEGLVKQSHLLRQLIADGSVDALALLANNLHSVLVAQRKWEIAYQSLTLFFANASATGNIPPNIVFINAEIDQLNVNYPTNRNTISHIQKIIQKGFNRFNPITEKYALIVIPGYLGNRLSIETWTGIAHDHIAILITDCYPSVSAEETIDEFKREWRLVSDNRFTSTAAEEQAELNRKWSKTSLIHLSHVIMTANQVLSRSTYADYGESEPLYVPLSAVLAGAILRNPIEEPAIGSIYGILIGVSELQFFSNQSELDEFEMTGLITAAKNGSENIFTFCSATTLLSLTRMFNEHVPTYSIVRSFDWLIQGIGYLLNQRAYENWRGETEKELTIDIMRFLNTMKGPRRFLLRYGIAHFRKDPWDRNKLSMEVEITPNRLQSAYMIQFTGEAGRDPDTGIRPAWIC